MVPFNMEKNQTQFGIALNPPTIPNTLFDRIIIEKRNTKNIFKIKKTIHFL